MTVSVIPLAHQLDVGQNYTNKARQAQNDLRVQVSTGQKHTTFNQVENVEVLQNLERQKSYSAQIKENMKNLKLSLNAQKQTLERIQEITKEFMEELVLFNNGSIESDPSVAEKAQNRLNEIERLLNQLDPTGQNPFAGDRIGNAVDMSLLGAPAHPGSVADFTYFTGSATGRHVSIAQDGTTIEIQPLANRAGLEQIVRSLNICANINYADPNEDVLGKLREAQGLARTGLEGGDGGSPDALIPLIESLDTKLSHLEGAGRRNESLAEDIGVTLAEMRDTDTAAAIIEQAQKEVQAQVGYAMLLSMLRSQDEVMNLLMRL